MLWAFLYLPFSSSSFPESPFWRIDLFSSPLCPFESPYPSRNSGNLFPNSQPPFKRYFTPRQALINSILSFVFLVGLFPGSFSQEITSPIFLKLSFILPNCLCSFFLNFSLLNLFSFRFSVTTFSHLWDFFLHKPHFFFRA